MPNLEENRSQPFTPGEVVMLNGRLTRVVQPVHKRLIAAGEEVIVALLTDIETGGVYGVNAEDIEREEE